ncbi:MAG: efflux RND transporter permease subunit [Candidatus Melainabacteria bacterium]|nr:efflux RND transporter permease subunit [Candidatus Melainabacteria bacterium]
MWLSDISIRRPVLATVMAVLLMLFGVVALTRLPVREYPDIDPPIVSVSTIYTGASPEVIERTVTEPLEEELSTIDGIRTLASSSQESVSQITIEFNLGRDVDVGAQDVRDRVSRARGRLPNGIEEPIVAKQDADASPILWLVLQGERYTPLEMSDYADRFIKDRLQTVDGVSKIIIGGAREYAMRVWLDPTKMAARGVTALDVRTALQEKNVDIPSGRVEGQFREFTVRSLGDLTTAEAFNNLVVKTVNGQLVRLREVGTAEVGAKDERSLIRFRGKPAIGLGIVKQAKANTLTVAQTIKSKIAGIQKNLPAGLRLDVAYDASIFIERSIEEVRLSLFQSIFLVVVVIWMFLGSVRATIIPAVSIPVSIVTTFAILDVFGFSVNILTLLSLVLAIGLVVDDTIVVLENVYRHLEMGKSPMEAAKAGTREVGFAVIATTAVLVAVFVPLAYMQGSVGRLFVEFAFALAGAVVISAFAALSTTPMLCAKLLKSRAAASTENSLQSASANLPQHSLQPNLLKQGVRQAFGWLKKRQEQIIENYGRQLAWGLRHPLLMLAVVGAFTLVSVVCYVLLSRDFLPVEDRGRILTLIEARQGATLAYTDQAVRKAEALIRQVPEVDRYTAIIALGGSGPGRVNSGLVFTSLYPWEERTRKQQTIVKSLFPKMFAIPEALVFSIDPPSGPGISFKPLELVLQGFNLQELHDTANRIVQRGRSIPGLVNLESELKLDKPQLEVNIQREQAAELEVPVRDIAQTLQILLGGADITTFSRESKRYDVVVQLFPEYRLTSDVLKQVYVEAKNQQMIPLDSLVNVTETVTVPSLNHYGRLRSARITGTLLPFITLGNAMEGLEKIVREEAPEGIEMTWAGQSRELVEAQTAANFVFLLSLLVVFLVLAAQFESFTDPLIILVSVPLALSGALITLFLTDHSINVFSQIGIILLIGLVTKNGILIVEYANTLREEHPDWSLMQAATEASKIRFRPILMTAISTILGAVPLAFAVGAGAESRQPMGMAIVGGMFFSTLLTLFVVPLVYVLVKRLLLRVRGTADSGSQVTLASG